MSKTRAAGVLGVLTLCGLLVLTSLAVAAGEPFFRQLQAAFRLGCVEKAPDTVQGDKSLFREVCFLLVDALDDQTLRALLNLTVPVDVVPDALVDVLGDRLPKDCDKCVIAVGELESFLGANGTASDLQDALNVDCATRFKTPTDAARCEQIVGHLEIGVAISFLLTNFPPGILCQELDRCPVP